ncbi:MAG: toxin [Thermoleophilia bacterium]|nr:toxin [Thermoleophilia bacterium]
MEVAEPTHARRIRVVGTSGSGKTTLAAQLAAKLGLAHVELDACQHGPAWQERSDEEFTRLLQARVDEAPGGWVMCGNYLSRAPIEQWQPDLVVWIDLSRSLVMTRVLRRTIVRLATRRELWNGNRESLSTLWSRDGIVRWAWRTHAKNRSRYERMMEQADDGSWVCLRSPREVAGWLESLPAVSVD